MNEFASRVARAPSRTAPGPGRLLAIAIGSVKAWINHRPGSKGAALAATMIATVRTQLRSKRASVQRSSSAPRNLGRES